MADLERIFCKNCKNLEIKYGYGHGDIHYKCLKGETESFDPIEGPIMVYRNCREKNGNFDCEDFEWLLW